ncbi:MAG: carboxypeptidase-like regulatory domain-containing protein [Dehalococcoidales bacterium]|nr:carboxypeptidase-like regulatory domain-containing protein [Dehalococcoidales bacterium]
MLKRIVLMAMALLLFLPLTVRAADPAGNGTISGQIVNGTTGGSSVANLDIALKTNLKDASVGSTGGKTDAEGRFTFSGLATDSTYSYQIVLIYQKADYVNDLIIFGPGETTQTIKVNVYDSTASEASLSIVLAHMVFYAGDGSMQVKEYAQFANMSDRAYIGSSPVPSLGRNETLRFDLPKGATDLAYSMGLLKSYVAPTADGFVDTMAVIPGVREVSYSYKVPYVSGSYAVSRKVNYPIKNFNLLIEDKGGLAAASSMLAAGEALNIGGTQFKHYAGGNFLRGDTITAQLSAGSFPAPAQPSAQASGQGDTTPWVVLVVVLLAVALGVVLVRRKQLQPVASSAEGSRQGEDKLLLEIARLDDDFEKGNIPEESYRKLRAEKKARLAAWLQGLKGDAGNG